jgi:hypothetical protein
MKKTFTLDFVSNWYNIKSSVILECITSMNLVEICNQNGMHTPTVWILSVYDILKTMRFCSSKQFAKYKVYSS